MKLKGFTTIELLAVLGLLGLVLSTFWHVLLINDKIWNAYKIRLFELGDEVVFEKAIGDDWRKARTVTMLDDHTLVLEWNKVRVEYSFSNESIVRNKNGKSIAVYNEKVTLSEVESMGDLVTSLQFSKENFQLPMRKSYDATTMMLYGH